MQTFIQKKELYTCCTPFTLVSLPPLHLTPYTLHPTPYTLHPTPYTLPHTPICSNLLLTTNFLCKKFACINYFSYLCALFCKNLFR